MGQRSYIRFCKYCPDSIVSAGRYAPIPLAAHRIQASLVQREVARRSRDGGIVTNGVCIKPQTINYFFFTCCISADFIASSH